ncbi:MAG: DUF2791 family P-loop domain-containing protein, partial [Candidatus Schekmanbacteria bacterium]|nr:DUF2791 family P-loop domain-containing protein [Candidatus Schekmanbacteria bacterium]
LAVGRRVRALYPARNGERVLARVDDPFLAALVTQITAGFGGKVALAPRLFLRELIDVMDRVDLHEAYQPSEHYRLELDDGKLTDEELAAKHGRPLEPEKEAPSEAAPEDTTGVGHSPGPEAANGRRLDG